MFDTFSFPVAIGLFVISASAIWIAGIFLSNTTDVLSTRLKLGEALGGLILLAFVTNLPEIAITASAALHHDLGLAIGNILGGIAIQTVVLVLLDVFGLGRTASLSYRAASLVLVVEGLLVVAVLVVVLIGTQLPGDMIAYRVTPPSVLIAMLWLAGLWLVGRARQHLPWHDEGTAPDGQAVPRGIAERRKDAYAREQGYGLVRVASVFIAASVVTLIAGMFLEQTSEVIANHFGMRGVVFGATVLAAATSLPELSTGLASIKLGDYQLAVSDIFGGNAFLPVLFLMATLLSGEAVLPSAQKTDIYLTALAILLTVIYLCGLLFRPRRQIARMGVDSLLVLALYIAGIIGLAFIK
jgi:cation:H+ antiporter